MSRLGKYLNRKQIAIVSIVVLHYSLYYLLATFPIVTYLVPQFRAYFDVSPLLLVAFYALFFLSTIFRRIHRFEYRTPEWMRLHYFFSLTELLCLTLFVAVPLIVVPLTVTADYNVRLLLVIWYMSFGLGSIILFHRVRNTLGMHYVKIGVPSLNGAVGFAELSILALRKKQPKGLDYLWKALFVLRENLRHEKKDIKDLDETIAAIETISSFQQRIPYERSCALATELVKLPALGEIPQALHSFRMSKEMEWTQALSELQIKKQRERMTAFFERYVLPVALVVVTLLGILPENIRVQTMSLLQQLQWMQIVGFSVMLLLLFEFFVLLGRSLVLDVSLKDTENLSSTVKTNGEVASPTLRPLEVKLADVLFIAVRKHLMVFKDLTASRHVHYTMVMTGSLIDFHKTLEDQDKHIHFVEIEFDWQFLIRSITQQIVSNWRSIFQVVKAHDPRWSDLEIEFIPIQAASELFSGLTRGTRLNVDERFVDKLEKSVTHSRLGDLSNRGFIIGTGSGYLVISYGAECLLINTKKTDKLFEKSFEAAIRKIRLRHFTPRLMISCLRIRLLILRNSAIRHLKRSTVPV